jgi:hypothetical protein
MSLIQEDNLPHVGAQPGVRAEALPRIEYGLQVDQFAGLEAYLGACVSHERFRSAYLPAHERWFEALAILYGEGSTDTVLAAGDKAREALREFACAIAEPQYPHPWESNSTEATLDCLHVLTETYRLQLGDARCELLQALFEHWQALSDGLDWHVHDGVMVREAPRWEDAWRVVILTALVMVEIDRSF